MEPGAHAVLMRQVYNKTRSYLEWMAARVGGSVTVVDDGDAAALAAAIRPETRLVFAETFTNPLVRAQDFDALRGVMTRARGIAPASPAGPRHHDCVAVGVQDAAAQQRRRRGRRQRHQVARRQRSRHVGLHRDQRHAVRQLGDGPDRDARRHPRLAPGGGGGSRVRRRRRRARAPLGDGSEGGGVSERPSPRSARCFIHRCRGIPIAAPSTRTTRATARCCRSGSPAPTTLRQAQGRPERSRGARIAHATSPTCWPRRSSCAMRCRSTGSPPRSTIIGRCRNISPRPISSNATASIG